MDFAPGLSRSGGAKRRTPLHHCRRNCGSRRITRPHAAPQETHDARPLSIHRRQVDRSAVRGAVHVVAPCCAGGVSRASDHADRAVGRRRRHRCGGAHPGRADGKGPRPTGQRGQPHRRLGRRRPSGDLGGGARRLHDRHHHGRDRHDAPPGSHRPEGQFVHADRAGQCRSGRRAGACRRAVQEPQRFARRDQGQPGQVQGLGHRPGRHLAPGDRRPAARPEDRSRVVAVGADRTAPRRG